MAHPQHYKTLKGLLNATERTLQLRQRGVQRLDGQSIGMWLHNAQFTAESHFRGGKLIRDLMAKYAVTRPQDLIAPEGGHAVFGLALPTREYGIGDNVPGVGQVTDATETQVRIYGVWYHRRCFGQPA